MNKSEFIKAVAEKAEISQKEAEKTWTAVQDVIFDTLKEGDKITLVGFGVFDSKKRPERTGINPATKESITIAASVAPSFKAGKGFKDALNK